MGFFSGISNFFSDPTGAKAGAQATVEGLRRAGKFEEAALKEAQEFRKLIMSETDPYRKQALIEMARYASQAPGSTEFYKRALSQGTRDIAEQAAGYGLLDTGATRRGFGELGAGLLSQEEMLRQQGLAQATSMGQTGYGLGLGALGQESAIATKRAQTEANIGAAQGAAAGSGRRFWGGLLGQVGGAALGGYLGGVGYASAAPAASMAGGFTVPSVGLKQGTGYNFL